MAIDQNRPTKSIEPLINDLADISTPVEISGVAIDSRKVQSGDLFMAYRGSNANGMDFIDDAIDQGAIAIAIDSNEAFATDSISVPVIKVDDLRQQAGKIISRFYGEPSQMMQLIGVTGTNGKSTVTYMIAHVLYILGHQPALIGTLGQGRFSDIKLGNLTTPDPIRLHQLFSSWKGAVDTVAMEVSSHALDQGRVSGVAFDIAVFTNLSRDHLDYHESLEDYAGAKFRLFETPGLQHAIINIDDEYGVKLLERLSEDLNVVTYSTRPPADSDSSPSVYCENIKTDQLKTEITVQSPWGQFVISTGLLGHFNIENILAAFTVLCVKGIKAENVVLILSSFVGVPGRMEYFVSEEKPMLVVDYAHTPDALEKSLLALRPYCNGKLYCVFGCGGDRDIGKREQMGAIAEANADQIVLTNDNPRSESPEKIVEGILQGIQQKDGIDIRYDRSDAITNTFLNASKEDIVLVAGKGHETTQEAANEVSPFSDRDLARRLTEGET